MVAVFAKTDNASVEVKLSKFEISIFLFLTWLINTEEFFAKSALLPPFSVILVSAMETKSFNTSSLFKLILPPSDEAFSSFTAIDCIASSFAFSSDRPASLPLVAMALRVNCVW